MVIMSDHAAVATDEDVRRAIASGEIVVDPFDERCLGSDTYDVRLGKWYFCESSEEGRADNCRLFYDVRDARDVERVWEGPYKSVDQIWLAPGETILAHTQEFIGARSGYTTRMSSRSSIGRSMLGMCKCAGRGDVGYFNRWTMEITSFARHHHVVLHVGMRVAQIEFLPVGPTTKPYGARGKYQDGFDLERLKREWRPEMMLPRLDQDWELRTKNG